MKKIAYFVLCVLLLLSTFTLGGCQSADENENYMTTNIASSAEFTYDRINNATHVRWYTTFTNNTIYDLIEEQVKFKLYKGDVQVETKTVTYTREVKHGTAYSGWFSFAVEGEVDGIEYVSWYGKTESLWETYSIWFIGAIVIVSVGIVVYVLLMIFMEFYLDDVFDVLEDWLGVIIGVISGVVIITIAYWVVNWVSAVIVVGALVSFCILALLAHGVQGIVLVISEAKNDNQEEDDQNDVFDAQFDEEWSEDYNENGQQSPEELALTLSQYTKVQLKQLCYDNGLWGYSNLNKQELISFLVSAYFGDSVEQGQKNDVGKQTEVKTSAIEELDKLIGLESVKKQLKRIRALLIKNKDAQNAINLHMCFYGNPGTGKSVVARLMADVFYETGVLTTNKLIETDRSGLCGQYVGETGVLTHKKVKQAMGGVLFIDEAYTLYGNGQDYGPEAIAALLKDMEDYKGKFCVILAGYKEEMEKMIALNPGFDSRINRKIDFPDYTQEELLQICDAMLLSARYEIAADARERLKAVFEELSHFDNFANARTVRNVLDSLIEIQAVRSVEDEKLMDERIIRLCDVETYVNESKYL